MEDFVARRTKTAESKIALAEAQALADVRAAAADAAVTAASTILTQSVKGPVADDLLAKGIDEVRAEAELIVRCRPREGGDPYAVSSSAMRKVPATCGSSSPIQQWPVVMGPRLRGDDGCACVAAYFFFTTFGFGSGFSACGSKPI